MFPDFPWPGDKNGVPLRIYLTQQTKESRDFNMLLIDSACLPPHC